MRTPRELAASGALILAACADPPPPPVVPEPLPACAAYATSMEVYAYCVDREVTRIQDPDQARALCETLPPVESAACRKMWVDQRMRSPQPPPPDALLAMCADMPDCKFAVIEFYREEDVLAQARQCRAHAGRFASDCVGHALQQWQMRRPDRADHARVIAGIPDYPHHVGNFVGLALACEGERLPDDATIEDAIAAGCPGDPDGNRACKNALQLGNHRPIDCSRPPSSVPPPPGAPPNLGVVAPPDALPASAPPPR